MNFVFNLNESSPTPLYRQLADNFVQAIETGILSPGQVMPSTYHLSDQYGVSRVTTLRCYELLKRMGLVTAVRGGRTRVNPRLAPEGSLSFAPTDDEKVSLRLSAIAERLQSLPQATSSSNNSWVAEIFPHEYWWRLCNSISRQHCVSQQDQDVRLRKAICTLLFRTRGLHCDYRDVIVFPNTTTLVSCLAAIIAEPADQVTVAQCAEQASHAYAAMGTIVTPLDSTQSTLSAKSRIVHLNVCTIPSAAAWEHYSKVLTEWLGLDEQRILIEDETQGMLPSFSHSPSLFEQDKSNRTIYAGSFSWILGPICEVAYAVMPPKLRAVTTIANKWMPYGGNPILNTALLEFIERGQIDLLSRKLKNVFANKQRALVNALCKYSDVAKIVGSDRGIALSIWFAATEEQVSRASQQACLTLSPVPPQFGNHHINHGSYWMIPIASVNEDTVSASIEKLFQLLNHEGTTLHKHSDPLHQFATI